VHKDGVMILQEAAHMSALSKVYLDVSIMSILSLCLSMSALSKVYLHVTQHKLNALALRNRERERDIPL
jgi:hypothetical protein